MFARTLQQTFGVGLCLLSTLAPPAAAQDYPTRPIHVVVGFAAGSGADIGVRHVATRMAEIAKATVVVENKPGAGSNIAVGVVANAKPDGYTMLMAASSAMAGSRYLYKDFKIDTEAAFEPVATLWRATFILAVDPKSPIISVADLTAYLKATPKTLHGYTNQTGQLAAAYYLSRVGATSASVSYRVTTDAVADLNAGSIHFMMIDGAFGSAMFRAARIKPLAVTSLGRSTSMPDVLPMSEAGLPGFQFAPIWAAYFPRGTPRAIVDKASGWLIDTINHPDTLAQFKTTGSIAVPGGPDVARKALRAEIESWAVAVKAANIDPQ